MLTSRNSKPEFRHWSAGLSVWELGGGVGFEGLDLRHGESNLAANVKRLQLASLAPASQGHACDLPASGKLCG